MDAFTENWEIAQDFKRLPQQFRLDKNVLVSIYQRTRPTSVKTVLNTLIVMQERIQPKPGNESNWVVVDRQYKSRFWLNKDKTINLKTIFQEEPVTFIYFGSIPELIILSGKNQTSKCLGFERVSLNLKFLNKQGSTIDTKTLTYSARKSVEFPLEIQGKEAAYLLVEFQGQNKSNDISYCSVYIKYLAVTNAKQ
ncbi:MAG: hypothetical protein MUD14_04560 [Hydrococcus sp. Prado102]|nr:hypothetical protein [Hydrococcus sp. Prado102]